MMLAPFKGLAKTLGFAPKEQKSISLSDPLAHELFGMVPTISGANVTSFSAFRVPAVLHAVRLIAENCGSTPVKVYREADEGKEAAKDHPAYRIVHRSANEWTSAVEFRSMLTTDALMHGGGFARVVRFGDGRPFELHRLEPGKVTVLTNAVTGEPVYRVSDDRGQVDYSYSDILYLPAFAGTSPIALGKEAIGVAMILERHMARFFGSGTAPKSIIWNDSKTPGNEQGERTIANIRKAYRQFAAGDGSDPLILDAGWKFAPGSLNSTDAQFLEHRREQINEIARLFGVPPHMLFQLDRATWSNSEEMSRSFLQLCLRPWLDRWQDAYNRVLFTEDERDTHYCEFVIDDLQRADSAGRAEIFSKLISSRAMTPNEARATMNLPPLPGGGELANPYVTTTTTGPASRAPVKESE
jgi:HK97 family phage portal protein